MSSIPMGAHAAFKVRDQLGGGGGGGAKGPGRNERQSNQFRKEQQPISSSDGSCCNNPPLQYNGKLMNSIWGMYNRYSVHNIKSHIAYDNV